MIQPTEGVVYQDERFITAHNHKYTAYINKSPSHSKTLGWFGLRFKLGLSIFDNFNSV